MKIREVCGEISYVNYGICLLNAKEDTQNSVKLIYNSTVFMI